MKHCLWPARDSRSEASLEGATEKRSFPLKGRRRGVFSMQGLENTHTVAFSSTDGHLILYTDFGLPLSQWPIPA